MRHVNSGVEYSRVVFDAPNWHSNVVVVVTHKGIDKGIMKVKVRGVPKLRSINFFVAYPKCTG